MAAIIADKRGYLLVQFYYQRKRYREYLKLRDTRDNRKAAKRLADDIELELRTGKFDYAARFPESKRLAKMPVVSKPEPVTISLAAARWLSNQQLSRATVRDYRYLFAVYLDRTALGAMMLGAVTPSDIRAVVKESTSARRTTMFLQRLRAIFESAMDDELIEKNPAARVKNPRPGYREPIEPLTATERTAIINAAIGQDRALIIVRMGAGLRIGETLHLRHKDIDLAHRKIIVAGSVGRFGAGPAKTPGSHRLVDILDVVAPVTNALRSLTPSISRPVFANRLGAHLDHANWARRVWPRILKRAGVEYREPNVLRHTYAVAMLEAGFDAVYVAQQMGHTSTQMIHRHYARWMVVRPPARTGTRV